MSYDEIIIISIAVIGSSVIKNGVGVGAGIFLLPLLALVLPPKLALGLGAPAMLISDIVGVKNYWGAWDRKELKLLLPSAAVGVLFGCFLIKVMPDSVFKQCVGIFALLFSSLHIFKMIKARYFDLKEVNRQSGKKPDQVGVTTMLFGFLGGVASTVAHAGGLILSVYLIQKRVSSRVFVGTMVLFLGINNVLKVIAYWNIGIITGDTLLLIGALSPAIIIGGLAGNELNKRIPQDLFRLIVLALIFCIGMRIQLTV